MSLEFPPGDGAVGLLRDIRLTHRTFSVKKESFATPVNEPWENLIRIMRARDTPQKMTVLQKFYLIFVPERHFCGVSQSINRWSLLSTMHVIAIHA
jgi:hypothetical protein